MNAFGTWHDRLLRAESHVRGEVLLEAWDEGNLTVGEYRTLIDDWWTSVDAWGDRLDEALEMLRWLAPVGEIPMNDGTFTVYRTTAGEEPDGGSWTLERAVADRFVAIFSGPRGAFLGIDAPAPVVWVGTVDGKCVLGYFNDRNESEVVLPHGAVRDVRGLSGDSDNATASV